MTAPLELTWSLFGDVVHPLTVNNTREPHFVLHACDAVGKAYYCETHDQHLANVGNLVMHIEAGGAHRIAIWCPKHRVYEAPESSQIEGFEKLGARTQRPTQTRTAQ